MKTLEETISELPQNEKAILRTLVTYSEPVLCSEIVVIGPTTGKRLADYSIMSWLEKMEKMKPSLVLSEVRVQTIQGQTVRPKFWHVNPEIVETLKLVV